MARDVLAIPISSVASECAFSTGGRILDPFRSSLTPKLVQSLICLQDWLRSEPIPINVEEDLEYLEQLELGLDLLRGILLKLDLTFLSGCFSLILPCSWTLSICDVEEGKVSDDEKTNRAASAALGPECSRIKMRASTKTTSNLEWHFIVQY